MSTAVSGSTSTSQASTQSQTTNTKALDPLANEQTFLKLLVSQLQNQDPLNPTDSNQFVSQLTSYSQLEQLIGIRQNTTPVTTDPTAATDPAAGANPTTLPTGNN